MFYLVIPSIMFMPILSSNLPTNNSEFVKMSHAEVSDARPEVHQVIAEPVHPVEPILSPASGHIDHQDLGHPEVLEKSVKVAELMQNHQDGNIMFVPDSSGRRYEETGREERRIEDIMSSRRTLQELAEGKQRTTEAPPDPEEENIVFVSGRNHDAEEEIIDPNRGNHEDAKEDNIHIIEKQKEKNSKPKLDCTNLICNNTVESVCGGKIENNVWKYRLFLNECYYRKVNCAFRSLSNRYEVVQRSFCHGIAEHRERVQYNYIPPPPRYYYHSYDPTQQLDNLEDTRRQFSSRRATNKDMNGFFCSHNCPTSCPDDYEPECAVSTAGNRKVFLNHCKLDYNSCVYGVVWHRRPLSECVGGKKADMRQNRSFIGWMQRVGIVDGKGRLTLD